MPRRVRPSALAVLLATLASPGAGRAEDAIADRARAAAARRDAPGIVEAVVARYRSLDALSVEGEIVIDMTLLGKRMSMTTRFTAVAQRPDRYRVTWSTTHPSSPGTRTSGNEGAVWNAGDGANLYVDSGTLRRWSREPNDEVALAAATGISNGAAQIVELLWRDARALQDLQGLRYDGEEMVGGERCWTVSGSRQGGDETLWVSAERIVVRQYRQRARVPSDGLRSPTAKDIEEGLAAMGLPATEENKQRFAAEAERMTKQTARLSAMFGGQVDAQFTGTFRTVHTDRRCADFGFTPPPGTPRGESIVTELFKNPPAPPPPTPAAPPPDA